MDDYSISSSYPRISDLKELPEEFLRHWRALAMRTEAADPVCCGSAWQLAWLDANEPDARLWWMSSQDSAAVFTLSMDIGRPFMLRPPESGWCFGSTLFGPDSPEMLLKMLAELESRGCGIPALAMLAACIRGSREWLGLKRTFGRRAGFYPQDVFHNAVASLEGGVDGWLSRRSANFRQKLKKALKAGAAVGITFEPHQPLTEKEGEELYQRMLAVEQKSWKGQMGSGICERLSKKFYRCLLRRLIPDKNARVMFARHGEEDIGYIFGSTLEGIYRGQQFSFARDWQSFSVGNLMQYHVICELCEENFWRYDMGAADGPRMAYKSRWTDRRLAGELVFMGPGGLRFLRNHPDKV